MSLEDNLMFQSGIQKEALPAATPVDRSHLTFPNPKIYVPSKPARKSSHRSKKIRLFTDLIFLQKDLDMLTRTAYVLRSVHEGNIEDWLRQDKPLPHDVPLHPHPIELRLAGHPVEGLTNEYDIDTSSGRTYRLVVTPGRVFPGIPVNNVSIKYTVNHVEGVNPNPERVLSVDENPIHFLRLVERPSLKRISFEDFANFYNSGFARFGSGLDEYGKEKRAVINGYSSGEYVVLEPYSTELFDIHRFKVRKKYENGRNRVELEVEIKIPEKEIK